MKYISSQSKDMMLHNFQTHNICTLCLMCMEKLKLTWNKKVTEKNIFSPLLKLKKKKTVFFQERKQCRSDLENRFVSSFASHLFVALILRNVKERFCVVLCSMTLYFCMHTLHERPNNQCVTLFISNIYKKKQITNNLVSFSPQEKLFNSFDCLANHFKKNFFQRANGKMKGN